MRNIIYFSTLFCLILLLSCNECPECPPQVEEELTLTPEDAIPLDTFQTWVNNWDSLGQNYTATTLTKYFTLPMVDITEFKDNAATVGPDSVAAARFYLGLEIVGTTQTPHIMLVGVNSAGDSLTNAAQNQYIYDVSKPCPSMCGERSLPDKK